LNLKYFGLALLLNFLLFFGASNYFSVPGVSSQIKVSWITEARQKLPEQAVTPAPPVIKPVLKLDKVLAAAPPAKRVLTPKASSPRKLKDAKICGKINPAPSEALAAEAGSIKIDAGLPVESPPAICQADFKGDYAGLPVSTEQCTSSLSYASREVAMQPPVPVYAPLPDYPESEGEKVEGGEVLVKAMVSKTGLVMETELLASSGSKLLDQLAVETVRTWRFKPALENQTPVKAEVKLKVKFQLK
jgi:TonB family protein